MILETITMAKEEIKKEIITFSNESIIKFIKNKDGHSLIFNDIDYELEIKLDDALFNFLKWKMSRLRYKSEKVKKNE